MVPLSRLLLVATALLALACASPVSFVERFEEAGSRPVRKLALLPLALSQRPGARDPLSPRASDVVTARVFEALIESERFQVVPPADVLTALAAGGADPEAMSPEEVRRRLARAFGLDAVLSGVLGRFDGRRGGALPAAVSFSLELRAIDGILLWRGTYRETQTSLLEDIGSFPRASQRGFRWVDPEALAAFGATDLVRQLPGRAGGS